MLVEERFSRCCRRKEVTRVMIAGVQELLLRISDRKCSGCSSLSTSAANFRGSDIRQAHFSSCEQSMSGTCWPSILSSRFRECLCNCAGSSDIGRLSTILIGNHTPVDSTSCPSEASSMRLILRSAQLQRDRACVSLCSALLEFLF